MQKEMEVFYTVNNKEYWDSYLIRENLGISKSGLQSLEKFLAFPQHEILYFQNRKLYSLEGISKYLQRLIEIESSI
jgi:hypothetical protein